MKNQYIMKNLPEIHDSLYRMAADCVEQIDYTQMLDKKCMFIISVIEEARLKTFLEGLFSHNTSINVYILVQDYVLNGFQKNFGERCHVFGWQGGYSQEILSKMRDVIPFNDIDSFVFFSDFEMNLRDINFLEIAEKLNQKRKVELYVCTIGNDLFKYKAISLYKHCLLTYQEMGNLIGIWLDTTLVKERENI